MKTNFTPLLTICKNRLLKFKTITSLFFIIFLFGSFESQAQNTNYYATTDIVALINDLKNGTYDIYELTTSGGNYVITSTITLPKNCIIRGTGGLPAKPIISFSNVSTTTSLSVFKTTAASIIVDFENLELNGINGSTAGAQPIFLLSQSYGSVITSSNCYYHNFTNATPNGIYRIDGVNTALDIEGCIIDNCTGRLLNFYTPTTTLNTANYGDLILRNNIFSNTTGASSIIYYRSSGGLAATGVNATIDHCTFYKFASTTTDGIFDFRYMTGAINVTNCIFDQVVGGFSFAFPTPTIDYCYLNGFATPPTGTNTFITTPVYTNPTNLNFQLTNPNSFICGDKLVAGYSLYNYVTGINEIKSINTISSYGKTILTSETGNIQVYNLQGKQLLEAKNVNKLVTNLASGIYIVQFTNLNGQLTSQKVVME